MTPKQEAAMWQALEALEKQQQALKVYPNYTLDPHECEVIDAAEKAITNLREALDEPVQEPVAWRVKNATPPGGYVVFQQYPSACAELGKEIEPLYTAHGITEENT